MKRSKFNIEIKQNDTYFIFNTLHGTKIETKFSIDEIERGGNKTPTKEIYESLCENGMLTEVVESTHIVNQKLNDILHNDKVLSLIIMPTDACNADCLYCQQEQNMHNMSSIVVNQIIRFISNHIKRIKILTIDWFGGEPLLTPKIIEKLSRAVISLCLLNDVYYYSGITTNATLLSLEMFNKLYKFHIREYQITIDGLSSTHNVQRPMKNKKNGFQIIINNLIEIKKTKTIMM